MSADNLRIWFVAGLFIALLIGGMRWMDRKLVEQFRASHAAFHAERAANVDALECRRRGGFPVWSGLNMTDCKLFPRQGDPR